jgi:HEAT repeat protein
MPALDRFGADIVEILKTVKPTNVVLDIDAILKRPEIGLRLQMISTIVAVDSWPRTRLLSRVLADPTESIRAHALRQIAEARDPGLRPLMQNWIEDPAFVNRSGEEKIAAFKALARAGGPAMLGYLRAKAEPVDNDEKAKETRRGAVFGIREIGTPDAMNLLKVWFDAGDDQLKFFASEAMRMR